MLWQLQLAAAVPEVHSSLNMASFQHKGKPCWCCTIRHAQFGICICLPRFGVAISIWLWVLVLVIPKILAPIRSPGTKWKFARNLQTAPLRFGNKPCDWTSMDALALLPIDRHIIGTTWVIASLERVVSSPSCACRPRTSWRHPCSQSSPWAGHRAIQSQSARRNRGWRPRDCLHSM